MSGRKHYARYFVFLLVFVILGCQRAPSDTTTTNKEVVREFFTALDAQDFDALSDLLIEGFVAHPADGTARVGRDAVFELIRGFYSSFPDYTHVIEEMIAEGDLVAARINYGGTHQGDFKGVAPTGKQVDYNGMFMLKVVDGMVTEAWSIDDNLNLMSQLGMELVPASPRAE